MSHIPPVSPEDKNNFDDELKDSLLDDGVIEEITEAVDDETVNDNLITDIDSFPDETNTKEEVDEIKNIELEDELDELGAQIEEDTEDIDYDNFDDIDNL